MRPLVNLIVYSDLDGEHFDIAWFPERLRPEDRSEAKRLFAFELRVGGLKEDPTLYPQAVRAIKDLGQRLADGKIGFSHLIVVGHSKALKSKVRSYKGLFPRAGLIKRGEHHEIEIDAGEGTSFFMGIARITPDNGAECFDFASAYMWAFVWLSEVELITQDMDRLLRGLTGCLNDRSNSFDYMKVVPLITREGPLMFSFAKDMRDDSVSIRGFADKRIFDAVNKELKTLLSEQ